MSANLMNAANSLILAGINYACAKPPLDSLELALFLSLVSLIEERRIAAIRLGGHHTVKR